MSAHVSRHGLPYTDWWSSRCYIHGRWAEHGLTRNNGDLCSCSVAFEFSKLARPSLVSVSTVSNISRAFGFGLWRLLLAVFQTDLLVTYTLDRALHLT